MHGSPEPDAAVRAITNQGFLLVCGKKLLVENFILMEQMKVN